MVIGDRRGLSEDFVRRFGAPPEVAIRAPGRVNLIGEHTDYHEGFVLPMAISRAILLLGRRRPDRRLQVYSHVLNAGFTLDLDATERHPERWARYFQAVMHVLGGRYPIAQGADVLIDADLPPGGGLSSSSALVVGFTALLAQLQGLVLDSLQLAILGRDAEHWYGTKGGIMDQFAISHAHAERAILLDCRNLAHEDVPLPEGLMVVIANTGTRHNQIASPFAQRRQEAEAGLETLRGRLPDLKTLRDVTPDALDRSRDDLLAADPSGMLWRRCHHVVHENARVTATAAALVQGKLAVVGALIAESHASLRDDYEVSCMELDTMVAVATAQIGCVGARMTGGGFGGCTVNLVTNDAVDAFCARVSDQYTRATGIQPAIFATRPSHGIQVLAPEW